MQYHKIPQNVSVYEGRIIGKFTAKQFTYLAIGGILIFLILTIPLGTIYKGVFVILVGIWTILFALISYEGRGTDLWIALYSKAILMPTQRVWLKNEAPPAFFLPGYTISVKEKQALPKTREQLTNFLLSWSKAEIGKDLTAEEKKFLEKIGRA